MVDFKRMYLSLGNDLDLQTEILKEYLRSAEEAFIRLQSSLKTRNFEQARFLIHRMRGMAANIYASDLEGLLNQLEDELKEKGLVSDSLRHALMSLHEGTTQYVRQFLTKNRI